MILDADECVIMKDIQVEVEGKIYGTLGRVE